MNPAPTSQPKDSKPSRGKRGCFVIGVAFVLLVPGYYWMENYLGRAALEKVVSEYEADGDSLAPASFLPGAVPAAENFCATPLLDGIAQSYDGSPSMEPLYDRKRNLSKLLPVRPVKTYIRPATALLKAAREWTPQRAVRQRDIEWDEFRAFLPGNSPFTPPADEVSDVRAVYLAMDTYCPSFEELIAASRRPHAIFMPPAKQRMNDWMSGASLTNEMASLSALLALRARAATALGHTSEAVDLAGVLWRLSNASDAGCSEYVYTTLAIRMSWLAAVRDICRTPGITGELFVRLMAQPGSGWSPEDEMRREWRAGVARGLALWNDTSESQSKSERGSMFEPFDGDDRGFRRQMGKFGPSGWHDQNMARVLRWTRDFGIRPLRKRGLAALPGSMAVLETEIAAALHSYSPDKIFRMSGLMPYLEGVRSSVFVITRIRLTLLSIAMERYRLKHGRYPADAAALVPDCIAAIPPDIDGAPLRVVTSPDGATSVLYSIGWNLNDDWHGVIPATYKDEEDWGNADWPLSLPLPPLPPP